MDKLFESVGSAFYPEAEWQGSVLVQDDGEGGPDVCADLTSDNAMLLYFENGNRAHFKIIGGVVTLVDMHKA